MTDLFDTNNSDGDLGHFIGVVRSSIWSNPDVESKGKADYENSDRYQLYWYGEVLDILQDDFTEDQEEFTTTMSIGKDWFPEPDDNVIRHKDDPGDDAIANDRTGKLKPVLFASGPRRGSVYGKFLAIGKGVNEYYETGEGPAVVLDGGDEVEYDLDGIIRYFRANKITDPRNADIWQGLVFEFRGLGFNYGGDRKPRLKAVPTKYLGTIEEYEKRSGQTVGRSEGAGEQVNQGITFQTVDVASTLPEGTDDAVVETITSALNSSASHAAFSRAVLPLPEVRDNDELTAAVMSTDSGPWSLRTS